MGQVIPSMSDLLSSNTNNIKPHSTVKRMSLNYITITVFHIHTLFKDSYKHQPILDMVHRLTLSNMALEEVKD